MYVRIDKNLPTPSKYFSGSILIAFEMFLILNFVLNLEHNHTFFFYLKFFLSLFFWFSFNILESSLMPADYRKIVKKNRKKFKFSIHICNSGNHIWK